MHTFFAATSKLATIGSLQACLNWADKRIERKEAQIVKIFKARPQERYAQIIGEVTQEGHFATPGGRQVELARLKKMVSDGEKQE